VVDRSVVRTTVDGSVVAFVEEKQHHPVDLGRFADGLGDTDWEGSKGCPVLLGFALVGEGGGKLYMRLTMGGAAGVTSAIGAGDRAQERESLKTRR
jgi:hypothetical protein